MKKFIITNVIMLLLFVTALAQNKNVAIFDPTGNSENRYKEIIREEIYSMIIYKGVNVLERQEVNKILTENKIPLNATLSESQISEIGKLMNADLAFVTDISTVEKYNFQISCKLIDVQTALVINQHNMQTSNGIADLVPTTQTIVTEIFMTNEERQARAERILAEQKLREEQALAEQRIKDEKKAAKEEKKAAIKAADQNMNGHYISLGSSTMSSGYYGLFGLGYEYRYHILGINASIGYDVIDHNLWGYYSSLNACAGFKLYLANKVSVLRNLYFNVLPFCFFGQERDLFSENIAGNNTNIMRIDHYSFTNLMGVGLFFGYAPVWHVSKKTALGFNIDVGVKADYKFKKWCPINWDLGFIIKFD